MRICIDARWVEPAVSGITRYTLELISALIRLSAGKDDAPFLIILGTKKNRDILNGLLNSEDPERQFAELLIVPWGVFSPLVQILLPYMLKKRRVDVCHSPNYMTLLLGWGYKRIITIHDLIPALFPQYTPKAAKTRFNGVFKLLLRLMVSLSDRILTVSDNSRRDIIDYFGVNADQVVRVYNGVSSHVAHKDKARSRCTYTKDVPSDTKVLLYVGRFDPYKNIMTIVKALSCLKDRRGKYLLIVAGSKDDRYPAPHEKVRELGLEQDVIFTGPVTDDTLALLYSAADCLVIPSLYEGFCIPVVEAFRCRLPVVTSRKGAIPEVAGEAAKYVENPQDSDELAQAVEQVVNDKALCEKMIAGGLKRAYFFTWEQAARETLEQFYKLRDVSP